MTFSKIIILGCIGVVGFDAAASAASLVLKFPYSNAVVGSLLIYVTVGFLAAREKGLLRAVLAGAVVGTADATLGWGVSWLVGPGRVPEGSVNTSVLFAAAGSAVVMACFCAAVGGLVGRYWHAHVPA